MAPDYFRAKDGAMRSLLLSFSCLVIGALGALGYSHYFGEGKQLADLQDELSAAKTNSQQAKSQTVAMSAQIQQLTSTKEDLKKQLNDLKGASPDTVAPPASNPMAGMDGMMKAGMAQHYEEQLLLLKSRLHLTPEQEALVKAAMDEESKRGEEMAAKMLYGGKIDPQAMADLKNIKTVDQTLDSILNPDQKTAYQQLQTDQKNSNAEMGATVEMNQLAPLLQLNDSQKDQVYSALAQAQLDMQDPNWIKANANTGDPAAIMDAQAKAKEDALAKILTPDQLATYHQQAQSQLDMQKAMMQKLMPPNATGGPVSVQVISAPAAASP